MRVRYGGSKPESGSVGEGEVERDVVDQRHPPGGAREDRPLAQLGYRKLVPYGTPGAEAVELRARPARALDAPY